MTVYKKMALLLVSQVVVTLSAAVNQPQIMLTVDEAHRIVEAWERLESQVRAAREDTSNDPAAQPCCSDADLAMIRACICAIKNQLCILTQDVETLIAQVGVCTDPIITAITEDPCASESEINAICASLQSWVKTIISELRGNQIVCPG